MVGTLQGSGHRPPKCDPIDERAAAYLIDSDGIVLHPSGLSKRLVVNSPCSFEFENEVFAGRVVILHREPAGRQGTPSPYRSLFEAKRRRWELRWQGTFKKPVSEQVVFGAEIGASNMPKFNFAMRTIVSVLTKFAGKLARGRGSDMYTNVVEHTPDDETIFFRFPVYGSDLIIASPPGVQPPRIVTPDTLKVTDGHMDGSGHFRGPNMDVRLDHTYTFVFYSMYADFIYWDLQNIPMGFSGMSLNRIVGNQPISVSMRSSSGKEVYFRMLIGNRCSSPEWASYLSTSVRNSLYNDSTVRSEFYSAMSDGGDYLEDPAPAAFRAKRSKSSRLWRGIKRIIWGPTKYIGVCLRAPANLILSGSEGSAASGRFPARSGSRSLDMPPGRCSARAPDISLPIPENTQI